MNRNYQQEIEEHYKKEAAEHGLDPLSTMPDIGKRELEIESIMKVIKYIIDIKSKEDIHILDLGCGNGFTLEKVRKKYPSVILSGLDITQEMVDLANSRKIKSCKLNQGDVCNIFYDDGIFDLIYTERCIQNILDWEGQKKALKEVHRVLKKDGLVLLIEGFTDAHANVNKARTELGLDPIDTPYHNLLLDKNLFLEEIKDKFEILDLPEIKYNFLSSYDFVRLVLHPLVTKGEWIRNTEFVKFFGAAFPPIGNYSRTQAYVLKKI